MVSLADRSDQVSLTHLVLQAALPALLGPQPVCPLVATCVDACPSVPRDRSTYKLSTTSRGLLVRGTRAPHTHGLHSPQTDSLRLPSCKVTGFQRTRV